MDAIGDGDQLNGLCIGELPGAPSEAESNDRFEPTEPAPLGAKRAQAVRDIDHGVNLGHRQLERVLRTERLTRHRDEGELPMVHVPGDKWWRLDWRPVCA